MYLKKIDTKKLLLPILIVALFTGGCKYNKEELLYPLTNPPATCATIPASFNAQVLPLITVNCASSGCHDATASGGRIFQNYNQISSAKDRINIRVIVQKSMPPAGPLTPAEINIIKCWIEGGALNN